MAGNAPLETVLYSFTGGADGGNPYASLLAYGGALYGTTSSFGGSGFNRAPGNGTVFKLAPLPKREVLGAKPFFMLLVVLMVPTRRKAH